MENFFTIFDIEEKFEIDLDLLDEHYFALLASSHPDVVKSESNLKNSILINQGYNILKDEFERACHILELHGFFIKDDTKSPKLSPETLEYIIELHESPIEEIREILDGLKSRVSKFFSTQNYEQAALLMLEIRYITSMTRNYLS